MGHLVQVHAHTGPDVETDGDISAVAGLGHLQVLTQVRRDEVRAVWYPQVCHGSRSKLLQRKREREFYCVVPRVGLDKGVPKQVQVLQTEVPKVHGQHTEVVVCCRQEPEL